MDRRPCLLERVDHVAVVQVYADGFAALPLRQKILVWHLYLAALAGRDIYYDQRHALNLEIRDLLENILRHDSEVAPDALAEIRRYTKLFWINTGPYNNLTARKFVLNLTRDALVEAMVAAGAASGASPETLVDRLAPMLFDPAVDAVVTNKMPGHGRDILLESANNLYVGVTMAALGRFTERYGLNSRLVERDGQLVEEVYRVGGKYDREIRAIVRHLEDALPYATPGMADSLRALIRFYHTGEEADRTAYDIAWVRDLSSPVDTINGFVEVYMDPRGTKGAWEAVVYYVNEEKTRKIQTLAANAQWFEDHMPWEPRFRKPEVIGITAKAIEVVVETGDSGPVTPIGINLPNDQTIREQYGSKSLSLSNVSEAHEHTSAIEVRTRDGKTYYVMTDPAAFREGVGRLLAEVQRIKGEGDYEAARTLFETYGVHFDPALRDEVVARVDALNLPSYMAIVMPRLTPRYEREEIVEVAISYPLDLETQMLEYSAFARDADVLATPAASR